MSFFCKAPPSTSKNRLLYSGLYRHTVALEPAIVWHRTVSSFGCYMFDTQPTGCMSNLMLRRGLQHATPLKKDSVLSLESKAPNPGTTEMPINERGSIWKKFFLNDIQYSIYCRIIKTAGYVQKYPRRKAWTEPFFCLILRQETTPWRTLRGISRLVWWR